jgi:hypothetical protein
VLPALKTQDGKLPSHRAFAAGALAGITEAFVNCPFEVVNKYKTNIILFYIFFSSG